MNLRAVASQSLTNLGSNITVQSQTKVWMQTSLQNYRNVYVRYKLLIGLSEPIQRSSRGAPHLCW